MEMLNELEVAEAVSRYPLDDIETALYKYRIEPYLIGVTEIPKSRGLGDTIAKITHTTGLNYLATLYTKITGQPCGCADRQEALNKLVPYGVTEE